MCIHTRYHVNGPLDIILCKQRRLSQTLSSLIGHSTKRCLNQETLSARSLSTLRSCSSEFLSMPCLAAGGRGPIRTPFWRRTHPPHRSWLGRITPLSANYSPTKGEPLGVARYTLCLNLRTQFCLSHEGSVDPGGNKIWPGISRVCPSVPTITPVATSAA